MLQPNGGGGVYPEWVRVTVQSVTGQPDRPSRSVSRTVSSTAFWNPAGSAPGSMPSRNRTPAPAAAGSIRSPAVARNGLSSSLMNSAAAPLPDGRSMHSVVDSRKVTWRPKSPASVAWMTSFCTSP